MNTTLELIREEHPENPYIKSSLQTPGTTQLSTDDEERRIEIFK